MKSVFNAYGEVSGTRLLGPHAKTGMRTALVFYKQRLSAKDAISVLHGNYLPGRPDCPIQV